MPRVEQKTTVGVYRPVVGQNSRELAVSCCRELSEEEAATETAIRLSCEDPTEREYLSPATTRARGRLKAALAEFGRAFLALILAYLAAMMIGLSRKKVAAERGNVGRAELAVLVLQRLFEKFYVRRLIGRANVLKMAGARKRIDDEGHGIYSLKLAERRYRFGDGFCANERASAADAPLIRVLVGVRVGPGGEPVWSLKRFARTAEGCWREVHSYSVEDAESAMVHFYLEPSHQRPADEATPGPRGFQTYRRATEDAA